MECIKVLFGENVYMMINLYLWKFKISDINEEYHESWNFIDDRILQYKKNGQYHITVNKRNLYELKKTILDSNHMRKQMNLISNFFKSKTVKDYQAYGTVLLHYVPQRYYYTSGINLRLPGNNPNGADEGYVGNFSFME
tara:strand:- start:4529 stop:4945 length:417 start_codon:yes stop_codon:yes gene_type:complete